MLLDNRGRYGRWEVFSERTHRAILPTSLKPFLPDLDMETIWDDRFESIREFERHVARNGVVVLKFWLNVSLDEQARRFLSRLEEPEKHWKSSREIINEESGYFWRWRTWEGSCGCSYYRWLGIYTFLR